MSEYVENFCRQVYDYKERYGARYRKISWHMFWFLLRNWSLGTHRFKRCGNVVNVGFFIPGGIGDVVMAGAYIDKFIKALDCKYKIHLFVQQNVENMKVLFDEYKHIVAVYSEKQLANASIDLLIEIKVQFPEITFYRENFIKNKSQFLVNYVKRIKEFNSRYVNVIDARNVFVQQILLNILEKNRITGMDAAHLVGLSATDSMNIAIPNNSKEILKSYGLKQDKFVTFAYSLDILNESDSSVRLWPKQHLQNFINEIKIKYPDYKIVQLGIRSLAEFDNVDINLVNKTSFEELITLLASSKLHIDAECGMVHLRHAINAKQSVVLHGPTSVSTKGYAENINISSNVCNCPCCECLIHKNWERFCIKTDSKIPACMQAISPDLVMEKIKGVLK